MILYFSLSSEKCNNQFPEICGLKKLGRSIMTKVFVKNIDFTGSEQNPVVDVYGDKISGFLEELSTYRLIEKHRETRVQTHSVFVRPENKALCQFQTGVL
jgi:hypothetical protein